MSKTILLGAGNTPFSIKATKWNLIFMAILFFSQTALILLRSGEGLIDNIYLATTLIGGFYAITIAVMVYNKSSKYAPNVKVDDTFVEFKTRLFKSATKLKWADINTIEFKALQVVFHTNDSVEILSYDTSADISIDIKEAIREVANKNNIGVIGG